MALPTDLPYCLVYPNIYSSTIPEKDRHHFNVRGGPPGLHTCMCICCTLLQHADTSTDHRQQHHRSHLVIPQGAQYDHLQLEDNIFPGTPNNSLLYASEELMKLRKMRFQVATHCPAQILAVCHENETSQLSHSSGEAPSSTSKNGDPPKATGSPGRKSSHHKCSPPLKEHHGSCGKDSHSSKKIASPHANAQHLQCRGPPPCG